MTRLLSIASLLLLSISAPAQGKLNVALKKELDSLFVLDQKYREVMMMKDMGVKGDSLARALNVPRAGLNDYLWKVQSRIDSFNLERIEKIIGQYGYPGKTLVGTPTNEAAFYIIQHSPKIKQYISIIKAAAQKGELTFKEYAKMHDRFLVREGKEQLYGTQGHAFFRQGRNGQMEPSPMFIWPISDARNVNRRRKEAGFNDTVEEYARQHGVEYKHLTLEEVKQIEKSFRSIGQ